MIVDADVAHENEEIMYATERIPQERVIQQTEEQVLEVSVAMTRAEIVHVQMVVNHHRH